jgi:hypothetical protein
LAPFGQRVICLTGRFGSREVLLTRKQEGHIRFAVPQFLADWRVILSAGFEGVVEMVGLEVSPVTDSSST